MKQSKLLSIVLILSLTSMFVTGVIGFRIGAYMMEDFEVQESAIRK